MLTRPSEYLRACPPKFRLLHSTSPKRERGTIPLALRAASFWREPMTTLRIGVIGVGHLGKEHARILSGLSGVELAGVAYVSPAQAEAVSQGCGTTAFADYRDLLERIDAAVIAVPTCFHHAVASDVLRRGIPTLVEKPLPATPHHP